VEFLCFAVGTMCEGEVVLSVVLRCSCRKKGQSLNFKIKTEIGIQCGLNRVVLEIILRGGDELVLSNSFQYTIQIYTLNYSTDIGD